jgi:hypothetical protein
VLQVSLLKKRVNIGSGTPNRIKKLVDIEALGLSRLDMIVIDMHPDVKGFSLFTLPQVRFGFSTLEQAAPLSSTSGIFSDFCSVIFAEMSFGICIKTASTRES